MRLAGFVVKKSVPKELFTKLDELHSNLAKYRPAFPKSAECKVSPNNPAPIILFKIISTIKFILNDSETLGNLVVTFLESKVKSSSFDLNKFPLIGKMMGDLALLFPKYPQSWLLSESIQDENSFIAIYLVLNFANWFLLECRKRTLENAADDIIKKMVKRFPKGIAKMQAVYDEVYLCLVDNFIQQKLIEKVDKIEFQVAFLNSDLQKFLLANIKAFDDLAQVDKSWFEEAVRKYDDFQVGFSKCKQELKEAMEDAKKHCLLQFEKLEKLHPFGSKSGESRQAAIESGVKIKNDYLAQAYDISAHESILKQELVRLKCYESVRQAYDLKVANLATISKSNLMTELKDLIRDCKDEKMPVFAVLKDEIRLPFPLDEVFSPVANKYIARAQTDYKKLMLDKHIIPQLTELEDSLLVEEQLPEAPTIMELETPLSQIPPSPKSICSASSESSRTASDRSTPSLSDLENVSDDEKESPRETDSPQSVKYEENIPHLKIESEVTDCLTDIVTKICEEQDIQTPVQVECKSPEIGNPKQSKTIPKIIASNKILFAIKHDINYRYDEFAGDAYRFCLDRFAQKLLACKNDAVKYSNLINTEYQCGNISQRTFYCLQLLMHYSQTSVDYCSQVIESKHVASALNQYQKDKGIFRRAFGGETRTIGDLTALKQAAELMKLKIPVSLIEDIIKESDERISLFRRGKFKNNRLAFFNTAISDKQSKQATIDIVNNKELSATEKAIYKIFNF